MAYKGPVDLVLLDFFGGLRSACTCAAAREHAYQHTPLLPLVYSHPHTLCARYIGAKTLEEMPRRTTFVRAAAY